ncbi:hypothetical protein EJ04DRAFT_561241 [Polyplosphaeria fusca]|uniref:Uncharacterized protein n=1 Tax=Polyplosphaeria fusca TaxID=682080 RepID=A0A9P4V2V0_9PLEO|nr:hypothetical protein EJ04DRAFT_561241 [Polyplosphaeria fusca]
MTTIQRQRVKRVKRGGRRSRAKPQMTRELSWGHFKTQIREKAKVEGIVLDKKEISTRAKAALNQTIRNGEQGARLMESDEDDEDNVMCGSSKDIPKNPGLYGKNGVKIEQWRTEIAQKEEGLRVAERSLINKVQAGDKIKVHNADAGIWGLYSSEYLSIGSNYAPPQWTRPNMFFEQLHGNRWSAWIHFPLTSFQTAPQKFPKYASSNALIASTQEYEFVKGKEVTYVHIAFLGDGFMKLRVPRSMVTKALVGKVVEDDKDDMITFSGMQYI